MNDIPNGILLLMDAKPGNIGTLAATYLTYADACYDADDGFHADDGVDFESADGLGLRRAIN